MKRKVIAYSTEKANGAPSLELNPSGKGTAQAYVSIIGNVDLQGDRVVSGAFMKSLQRWRASGNPIPIVWSHTWGDPHAFVGSADPFKAVEDARGLLLNMKFDLDDPTGAKVWELVKSRRVREWSFAYDVLSERPASDGANELVELDLIEAGPTLKGANPETVTVGTKSLEQAIDEALADPATFAAPKSLELARINKELDALVGSVPNTHRDGTPDDVDRFVAEQKRLIAQDRAKEARREAARERLRVHHEQNSDAPRNRVAIDRRNFLVVQEDDDAAERRARDLAELQAKDAERISLPVYARR